MKSTATIGIYIIKNKVNNKHYVGQSWNVEARLRSHFSRFSSNAKAMISCAIRKYGKEYFDVEIIPVCNIDVNQDQLDLLECQHIENKKSMMPHGYNMKGGGSTGKHTDKTKEKISKIHRGIAKTEDHRKKISEVQRGVPKPSRSIEYRQNISKAHMGVPKGPMSAEQKEKISMNNGRGMLGRKHSQESKDKNRLAHIGQVPWNKGTPCPEETKRKISQTMKNNKLNRRLTNFKE